MRRRQTYTTEFHLISFRQWMCPRAQHISPAHIMCAFNQMLTEPLTRPRRRRLMPFSLYLVREMNAHAAIYR